MNKLLRTKMDALADLYRKSHVTRDVWKEDKCFADGFQSCHDLMIQDIKKLVEALDKSADWIGRCMCIVSENSDDWKFARKALQEYKSKWGEG